MARWNGPDFNTNELAFDVISGMLLPAGLGCSGYARGQHAIDVTLKKAPSSIYLWWFGFQHAASDFAGMQSGELKFGKMEALVTFALACNVIQVVDASRKVYEIFTQFRKLGTTARADELRHSTQHLMKCHNSLQNSLSGASHFPLLESGVDLAELSRSCIEAAKDLEDELQKITVKPGSSRLSAWTKSFRTKMKSDHVEALKRKLDECARVLDSATLVHLSQNLGTLAAQQTNILDQLNDWQWKIYSEIVAGNTRIDSLIKTTAEDVKAHTILEHNITRRHIDRKFDDFVDARTAQANFDRFRESLSFPEIDQRQDTIEDAHRKTFEWIFDSTAHTKRPWDNFMLWTQDDNPIYWILGKPGSGKSTLMNFVVQNERTREAFEHKFAGQQPLIITFFFWEAGVDLQKSQVGLLRSIIWQILEEMDATTSIQIWSTMLQKISPPLPTVWTQKQLRQILQSLVQGICNPICLFLDGLDEFQGLDDHFEAIRDIIGVFRHRQKTKICIASRPSACLDSLYKTCPQLRLQDLTESDITRYVEDKLTKILTSDNYQWLAMSASKEMHELIREVVDRAEGVFLWVRLTVESLVRGIRKDDDWRILVRRLQQMPQGIFNLYEHMWKRMNDADHPFYAREAAAYLQYVLQYPNCSLIDMTIACDETLQESYLDNLATCDLKTLGQELNAETLKKKILTRCAGFLEIHAWIDENAKVRSPWGLEDGDTDLIHYPETMKRLIEIGKNHRELYVSFLHRTAREYLETESGKKLLQAQPLMDHELHMMRYKSTFVMILLGAISVERYILSHTLYVLNLSNLSTFDNYLDNHPEIACAMFVQLGEILEKLRPWGVFSGEEMQRAWQECFNDAGNLDYTKVFAPFSHPAYTKHKLTRSGLIHNRAYLTDLLGYACRMSVINRYVDVINAELLLALGADPNQMLLIDPADGDTTKYSTIWTCSVLNMHPSPLERTTRAFIEAGADLDTCIQFPLYSAGEYHDRWKPLRRIRAYDQSFVLAGSATDGPLLVVFEPPNAWRTVALEPSGNTVQDKIMGDFWDRGWMDHSDALNLLQVQDEVNVKFYSHGIDALRAGGFSDEDIQELGIPQTIWQDYEPGGGEAHGMNLTESSSLNLPRPCIDDPAT
ncbi:hypothetical protein AYO20_08263 [Fonsecaea nubica]|uniref:Uncharacterized protein n=1 Tax=Fonsecaea nubica TaxID=856822 RepID=A0A178CQ88_9EURO|nr:hypothetical protein AYO20_08263 [Fonsecaea nubica]OAL31353.1 hypothetical protein AYO20_08263 [Fonsecaea nubica]